MVVAAQNVLLLDGCWNFLSGIFNTYLVTQPDLYYFETIKMTSQA